MSGEPRVCEPTGIEYVTSVSAPVCPGTKTKSTTLQFLKLKGEDKGLSCGDSRGKLIQKNKVQLVGSMNVLANVLVFFHQIM